MLPPSDANALVGDDAGVAQALCAMAVVADSSRRVTRFLVVQCDAWPLIAAGQPADEAAVTVRQNLVVAANLSARLQGVQPGVRRREAQARCPGLVVLEEDLANDARAWEPVVAVLDDVTSRIEIPEPGVVAFPTRGPSRYFGGDLALAQLVLQKLRGERSVRLQVGIADGFFAASLASRVMARVASPHRTASKATPSGRTEPKGTEPKGTESGGTEPKGTEPEGAESNGAESAAVVIESADGVAVAIEPGQSPAWLAPRSVRALASSELTGVLMRLGLTTLGAYAQLTPGDVVGRFGQAGVVAHRLASGLDPRPPDTTPIPDELAVSSELNPPALRVDQVAFLGKVLADQLHDRLEGNGMACTQVMIEAETEHGEMRRRVWRHEGALSAGALSDRVRWQLDGWLNGDAAHRPTAGITLLRLVPDEVVPAVGRQLGFWGDRSSDSEKVARSVARVQGMLGSHAVKVPEYHGGRGLRQGVVAVSAASVDLGSERPATANDWIEAPWPGRLPRPLPARVLARPLPVRLLDHVGDEVSINGRGEISAAPHVVEAHSGRPGQQRRSNAREPKAGERNAAPNQRISAWAGPWLVDDRWWDGTRRARQGRMQIITEDGRAHLVTRTGQQWWFEATYD